MNVDLSKLAIGDVFYEKAYGKEMRLTVVTPVIHKNDQWKWRAQNDNDEFFDYLITDQFEHYGPKIYIK